jgi:predicted permease
MWSRFIRVFRRSRFEQELDEELRDHIRKYADDLVASGLSREEAERRSRRDFGGISRIKEDVRDAGGFRRIEAAGRYLHIAARVVRKNPVFALTVIVTLALAIGVNTAIFSVVNAMFLRPLPYPEPERLGAVYTHVHDSRGAEYDETAVRGIRWEFVRDRARTVDVGLHRGLEGVNWVADGGEPAFVHQMRVSSGFFRVLGVAPSLGREFMPDEDAAGGPAVVILSDALWKRAFPRDSAAIGKTILVRGEPYTVIGVMPEGFNTAPAADLWTPIRASRTGEGSGLNYRMIGRVRSGFSVEQAQAELSVLGEAFLREVIHAADPKYTAPMRLMMLQSALGGTYRTPVLLLWSATGLVLLIGCVNIAGLMLGRSATRRREMATRLALGSGRSGIVAQVMCESLLLAAGGGVLGAVLGYITVELFEPVIVETLQPAQAITIDWSVLIVTGVVTLATALLSGLYPALNASRTNIHSAMASSSRAVTGPSGTWVRRALVIGEVALGMVLLVSAGLMLRTVAYLNQLDPGFDPRNVLTATVSLRDARYSTREQVLRLYDSTTETIRNAPGVVAAGVGLSVPYDIALNMAVRVLAGPQGPERTDITNVTYGTPGYFEALHFRLMAGRWFTSGDTSNSAPVIIINEAFSRELYRGVNPLGLRVFINGKEREIVGVIGNVQQHSNWGDFGPVGPARSLYLPVTQTEGMVGLHSFLSPQWVVRTSGGSPDLPQVIRNAITSADSRLPIAQFRTIYEVRDGTLSVQRLESALLVTMAGLALLLAAIGIFGLIAHNVGERTREFGIRLALGCSRWTAVAQAAMPGLVLTAAGLLIGSFLSVQSGKLIRSLLIGVKADDSTTFAIVVATLLGAATAASVLPSLHVVRIDPAETLREE